MMELRSPVIRPVRRNIATVAPSISKNTNNKDLEHSQLLPPDAASDDSQETYFSEAENVRQTEDIDINHVNNPQQAHACLDDRFSLTFSSIEEQNSTNPFNIIKGKDTTNNTIKRNKASIVSANMVLESDDACVNNFASKAVGQKENRHIAILNLENKLQELEKNLLPIEFQRTIEDTLNAESTIAQIDTRREYLEKGGSRSEKLRLAKIGTRCCELKTRLRKALCTQFEVPITTNCSAQSGPSIVKIASSTEPLRNQDLPSLRALLDAKLLHPGPSILSLKLPGMRRLVLGTLKKDASILSADAKVYRNVEDWCSEYSTSGPISREVAYACIRYKKKKHLSIICHSFLPNATFETEIVSNEKQTEGNRSPPKKRKAPSQINPVSFNLACAVSGSNLPLDHEKEQSLNIPDTSTIPLNFQEVPTTPMQCPKTIFNARSQSLNEDIANEEPIEIKLCPIDNTCSNLGKTNTIWEKAKEQQDKVLEMWIEVFESAKQKHEAYDSTPPKQMNPVPSPVRQ